MSYAQDIIDQQEGAAALRAPWESVWADVAPFTDPLNEEYGGGKDVFDSEPRRAALKFATTAQSYVTPEGQNWHNLKPINERLVDNYQVKHFTDEMNKFLFRWRYDPKSGFQVTNNRLWNTLTTYSGACAYLEEEFGGEVPYTYQSVPVAEAFPVLNSVGQVDTMYRRYKMSAKQLAEKFKRPGDKLPTKITDAAGDPKRQHEQFEIIHGVYPTVSDKGLFAFESAYVAVDDKQLIRKGGYFEFPFLFSSFGGVNSSSPFGYCPAVDACPDMEGASHATRLMLRAAEKAIDPVVATHNDLQIVEQLNAGAMVPGLIDKDGKQLFQPIVSGANPALGKEVVDLFHQAVNGSFLGDLLMAVAQKEKQMTAQEALLIAEERGSILGPLFGNQEVMYANGVKRELAILSRKQQNGEIELPEIPGILRRDDGIDLEWNNPLSQLRKSGKARATMQFISAVGDVAQVDPTALDGLDTDEAIKVVGDALGVPTKVQRDSKAVQEIREARAKQQEQERNAALEAQAAQNARNVAPLIQATGGQDV